MVLRQVREVQCLTCGHQFHPFKDQQPEGWNAEVRCDSCGATALITEVLKSKQEAALNPHDPVSRPADATVTREARSEREILYRIPSSGTWGMCGIFALFWNLFCGTVIYFYLGQSTTEEWQPGMLLGLACFQLIGFGFIYAAFRHRFARY